MARQGGARDDVGQQEAERDDERGAGCGLPRAPALVVLPQDGGLRHRPVTEPDAQTWPGWPPRAVAPSESQTASSASTTFALRTSWKLMRILAAHSGAVAAPRSTSGFMQPVRTSDLPGTLKQTRPLRDATSNKASSFTWSAVKSTSAA